MHNRNNKKALDVWVKGSKFGIRRYYFNRTNFFNSLLFPL